MKKSGKKNSIVIILLVASLFSFSSCLTSKHLDNWVAEQYNHELPKPNKKKKQEIDVNSAMTAKSPAISTTFHKRDKLIPLLFYWKFNHRQICSLNPAIPVTNFTNSINTIPTKALIEKLNGRKLELTVEEAPATFSIVIKENMIWLIYAFSWAKVYIEPDNKDLVVNYKLIDGGQPTKTGTITIKNTEQNRGIRFFQSWTSATTEYLASYNLNITNMTKSLVSQLTDEVSQ
ncbi:MAG: hypothetical protein QM764_03425 [Chitinophagaceae bacterium]